MYPICRPVFLPDKILLRSPWLNIVIFFFAKLHQICQSNLMSWKLQSSACPTIFFRHNVLVSMYHTIEIELTILLLLLQLDQLFSKRISIVWVRMGVYYLWHLPPYARRVYYVSFTIKRAKLFRFYGQRFTNFCSFIFRNFLVFHSM